MTIKDILRKPLDLVNQRYICAHLDHEVQQFRRVVQHTSEGDVVASGSHVVCLDCGKVMTVLSKETKVEAP